MAYRLLALFLIKLAIVFLFVPLLTGFIPGAYQIDSFPDGYNLLAKSLLEGVGYRFYSDTAETLLRLPGYPIMLFFLFYFFGESLSVAKFANVLSSIITAILIYKFSRKFFGKRLNLKKNLFFLPSVIFLFHPGIILAESRGGVESLFTLLIMAFIYIVYRALESNRKSDYFFTGIVFGLTLMTRGTVAIFPVFFLFYILFKYDNSEWIKILGVNFTLMILGIALVASPWVIRNYLITSELHLLGTNKGVPAFQGFYLNNHLSSGKQPAELFAEAAKEQNRIAEELEIPFKSGFFQHFYTSKNEVIFYDHLYNIVFREYLNSPILLIKNSALNFYRFWFQGRTSTSTILNIILTTPVLVIVFIGIVLSFRNGLKIDIILLFIISFILPHLPMLGLARYQIPLIPLLAIIAAVPMVIWHSNYIKRV